jgi:hypothetical protein
MLYEGNMIVGNLDVVKGVFQKAFFPGCISRL